MAEYTNNTEYTITDILLSFKMKENIKDEDLEALYSYLAKKYKLSKDNIDELKNEHINELHTYLDGDKYLKQVPKTA